MASRPGHTTPDAIAMGNEEDPYSAMFADTDPYEYTAGVGSPGDASYLTPLPGRVDGDGALGGQQTGLERGSSRASAVVSLVLWP